MTMTTKISEKSLKLILKSLASFYVEKIMSHEKPSSSRICSSMEEVEKMKQDLIITPSPSDAEKEFRENLKKSKESLEKPEVSSQCSGMSSDWETEESSEEDFEENDMKKFFWACLSGDFEYFKNLAEVVDVNKKDPFGSSGLHMAAQEGNLEIVEWIIQNGGDVNIQCSEKTTPLHTAAQRGFLKIVESLIKNGADIDAKAIENNTTPLMAAVECDNIEIAMYLIKIGADIDSATKDGWTPLHLASVKGFFELVEYLIAKEANINAKGKLGETPLHVALQHDQNKIIEYLIEKGADVNSVCWFKKWAPIHAASMCRSPSNVELLIKNGANIEAKTDEGSTPLLLASQIGHLEMVKCLVQLGAQVNTIANVPPCGKDVSPLWLAQDCGHNDVVKYLLEHGADPDDFAPKIVRIFLHF